MISFNYAVVDDESEVIRQYRWSVKEAKWHKDQGKNVVKLDKPIEVKEDLFKLVGECLF